MTYAIDTRVPAPLPLAYRIIDEETMVAEAWEELWGSPLPDEPVWDPLGHVRSRTLDERGDEAKQEVREQLGREGVFSEVPGRDRFLVETLGAVCIRMSSGYAGLPAGVKARVTERIDKAAAATIKYHQISQEVEDMLPQAGETEEDYLGRIRSRRWS